MLSSLETLFQFLRLDHLRVFSSSSREGLQEQLVQQNQGFLSPSVTAAHFLHEKRIHAPEGRRATPAREGGADQQMAAIAVATQPSVQIRSREGNDLGGRGRSALESRRLEFELGPGGDHDVALPLRPASFDAASPRLDEAACQQRAWGIAILGRLCRQPHQSRESCISVYHMRIRSW